MTNSICSYENWQLHDPDGVTRLGHDELAAGGFASSPVSEPVSGAGSSGKIWPREDLLQCSHRTKPLLIDLGFYGDEAGGTGQLPPGRGKLPPGTGKSPAGTGKWIIHVIANEDWSAPVQRECYTCLTDALAAFRSHVQRLS